MSRKDYIVIAGVIRRAIMRAETHYSDDFLIEAVATAEDMAKELARDNPRFNHERFMKACGATQS